MRKAIYFLITIFLLLAVLCSCKDKAKDTSSDNVSEATSIAEEDSASGAQASDNAAGSEKTSDEEGKGAQYSSETTLTSTYVSDIGDITIVAGGSESSKAESAGNASRSSSSQASSGGASSAVSEAEDPYIAGYY